jgi:hypothetical protein
VGLPPGVDEALRGLLDPWTTGSASGGTVSGSTPASGPPPAPPPDEQPTAARPPAPRRAAPPPDPASTAAWERTAAGPLRPTRPPEPAERTGPAQVAPGPAWSALLHAIADLRAATPQGAPGELRPSPGVKAAIANEPLDLVPLPDGLIELELRALHAALGQGPTTEGPPADADPPTAAPAAPAPSAVSEARPPAQDEPPTVVHPPGPPQTDPRLTLLVGLLVGAALGVGISALLWWD